MKKIDWDKAIILANIYTQKNVSIYITAGDNFEDSIDNDYWSFKFNTNKKSFICAANIDYDMVAGGFSLNILYLDKETEDGDIPQIDFDIGVEL